MRVDQRSPPALPLLVRQVKQDPGSVVQVTVRGEVVAELGAAPQEPAPGAAET